MSRPAPRLYAVALAAGLLSAGCAGGARFRLPVDPGRDPAGELALLDAHIGGLPPGNSNLPLLRLERASLLMQMARYAEAAETLRAADDQLEVLDFTTNGAEVGDYLFTGSSGFYRGAPHEKILASTLATWCWLLAGDRDKARIEARRALSHQDYWIDAQRKESYRNALARLASGLAFEEDGKWNDAYIDYKSAFETGKGISFLEDSLLRLAKRLGHSDQARWRKSFGREAAPADPAAGEVVILAALGRAPAKTVEQVEIPGWVLATFHPEVSPYLGGWRLAKYPGVQPRPSAFDRAEAVLADGRRIPAVLAMDVEEQVLARYREERPEMLAKLFSRLVVRVGTVGLVTATAYKETQKRAEEGPLGGFLKQNAAALAAAITNAVLDAVDTPDLRCWRHLPKAYHAARFPMPAGEHRLAIEVSGSGGKRSMERTVTVEPGKIRYVCVVVPE